MVSSLDPSIVGLMTQIVGISLIAVLCLLLTRSIQRSFLWYWTFAWISLIIALGALLVVFRIPGLGFVFLPLYLTAEYGFGYFIVQGCRNYIDGDRLKWRDLWLLPLAIMIAILLTAIGRVQFDLISIPHFAIFAAFFFWAFHVLHPARKETPAGPGVRVMSVALLLLGFDFLHYVPMLVLSSFRPSFLPLSYLQYHPLYDLVFEVLLGFGTVLIVMESVARELEWSNRQLTHARDHMESLARLDPLTKTLNRHAFQSFMEQYRAGACARLEGCIAIVDMDDLKFINDSYGHAAGDSAICYVARAIRSRIRSSDLLFRWGGDEFLVIIFGLSAPEAGARLMGLPGLLANCLLSGCEEPVRLSVSYGVSAFDASRPLHEAIEEADDTMYAQKHSRRALRNTLSL
jgi:diguanylate cyclase (GGDEF)-like protein